MSGKRWNFKITPIRIAMFGIFAVTLVMYLYRYYVGLGAVTDLDDAYPWGAWIGADMNVIALAGAGFSMAIISHIFHAHKYEPLARISSPRLVSLRQSSCSSRPLLTLNTTSEPSFI